MDITPEPEKPLPAQVKTINPNKNFIWDFFNALLLAKPIGNYITRKGKAIYDGWAVFLIVACLISWFFWEKGCDY